MIPDIDNVTLVEIGETYQLYKNSERTVKLSYYNRASRVQVGDTGKLVFRQSKWGTYWFVKDETK
jgi:hypothetical protein